ncbi:MAG: InlB B-repeat-containing protein, partial [Erysipelotrichaceae bacterium]|nr:InlB B-repeat-containing protein [Erysipelotrichaceae bacterium]
LNYGTNPSGSPTFYYISSETFDLPIPTRKGYTFDGWYLSYNTKTKVYSDKIETVVSGSTGNLEIYAKWIKD